MKLPLKTLDQSNEKTEQSLFRPHKLIPEKIDFHKIFQEFTFKFPPHLKWHNFYKKGVLTAEVLVSAEIIQVASPTIDVQRKEINDVIPIEISPTMKKYRMEMIFAGIRDALKLPFHTNGRFKIEMTFGDLLLCSGLSGKSQDKNLNFMDPYASGYLVFI